MTGTLDVSYPAVRDHFEAHLAAGRSEPHAFLAWFLESYYRLDDVAAQDAICDGPDDKGIDGIYVDDNLERIDVFQSRLVTSRKKTLGDTQLKEFVGTLAQFGDPKAVAKIAATTGNRELRSLIENEGVATKIGDGYSVRGVFVTNARRDASAEQYVAGQPDLALYDQRELVAAYVPAGTTAAMATSVTFDVYGYDVLDYLVRDTRVIVAPLSGSDLVKMDGIASGELFAWNVRQSLGKTKVNKEIGEAVDDPREHLNFLLYHNGLTVLCKSIETSGDKIAISGYSVVNGCQSLTSLHDHRAKVTDDLRILARLIELSPDSDLAAQITHRSNNQNAISARDLQSNSAHQRRLQKEFDEHYGGEVFYRIKRGEQPGAPAVIDNDLAARVLLAFDLGEPWACHQTYKLFDELHSRIFARPEVDAHRILALCGVHDVVTDALPALKQQLMAGYSLTRFFLLYLLRQALETDDTGNQFSKDPGAFLLQPNGPERIGECIGKILGDLIVDLNHEIDERGAAGNPVDYKRELKSPKAVAGLVRGVIPSYEKAVRRERVASFGEEWEASGAGEMPPR